MELKFLNKNYFIVCSNSDSLRVVSRKDKSAKLILGHREMITCSDLNPKNYLVTGSKDGKILLWKISNNDLEEPDTTPDITLLKKYKGHLSHVIGLSIGQKTGNVFVSCGADGMLKLWNILKQTCKTVKPHKKEMNFCRMNRNEKYVMTGSHDRTVILYSAKTLKVLRELKEHTRGVWDGDFAPFELLFATAGSDLSVKIWDLKLILDTNKDDQKMLNSDEIKPEETPVKVPYSNGKSKQKQLELSNDAEQKKLVNEVLQSAALTKDRNSLARGLLDTQIGAQKQVVTGPECLFTLEGHEHAIVRVKWVNLGLQLLSADSSGVIKLWNFRKAICLFTIHKHEGKIWALDVYESFKFQSADIKTQNTNEIEILSGDNNSTIFIWKDDTLQTEKKNLADRQKKRVIHSQIELKIKEKDFPGAIEICFDRNMHSWFFKTIERWQRASVADWVVQNIIFSFDAFCQQLYANILQNNSLNAKELDFMEKMNKLVTFLFDKESSKLLLICQSFITHSRYAWTVQLILYCVFGKCIDIQNLTEVYDSLKNSQVDLKKIINVYLNFSEKMLKRNEKQAKIIANLGFSLKRNKLTN